MGALLQTSFRQFPARGCLVHPDRRPGILAVYFRLQAGGGDAAAALVFHPAALALIGLAMLFFWISGWLKGQTGLPDGKIILCRYGPLGKTRQTALHAELGLTGKPDYLIRKNGIITRLK